MGFTRLWRLFLHLWSPLTGRRLFYSFHRQFHLNSLSKYFPLLINIIFRFCDRPKHRSILFVISLDETIKTCMFFIIAEFHDFSISTGSILWIEVHKPQVKRKKHWKLSFKTRKARTLLTQFSVMHSNRIFNYFLRSRTKISFL